MEIHALKLSITEADINLLVRKNLPVDQPLENVSAQVSPSGVNIKGVYPLFIDVHFEMLWQISIKEKGQLALNLANFKAMGVPANIFKSAVLKLLEEQVRQEEALSLQGESLLVDLEKLLAKAPIPVKLGTLAITCLQGEIVLEIGESLEPGA